MNKKIVGILGIAIMMLLTTVTFPAIAETDEPRILGRTHIRAIGSFAHCEDDQVVYGHIFIGMIGLKPVFNLNIEICDDCIKWIIMTNHFLNCAIKE